MAIFRLTTDHKQARARIEELTTEFSARSAEAGDTDKLAREVAGLATLKREPAPEWAAEQQRKWIRDLMEVAHENFEKTGDPDALFTAYCDAWVYGPLIGDPIPEWAHKAVAARFARYLMLDV